MPMVSNFMIRRGRQEDVKMTYTTTDIYFRFDRLIGEHQICLFASIFVFFFNPAGSFRWIFQSSRSFERVNSEYLLFWGGELYRVFPEKIQKLKGIFQGKCL